MPCLFGSADVVWATSWLVWIAAGVPRRSTKTVRIARFLAPPPDVKHVESESLPEICSPMPGLFEMVDTFKEESQEAGASWYAISRPTRTITCAEFRTGSFWTTTPPLAHSGWSEVPLVDGVEIDGALVACSNDCILRVQDHHGAQLLWPSSSRFGATSEVSSMLVRQRVLDGQCQHSTSHPSQPASHGSAHSHLAGDQHASVRASGPEDRGPRWVGPHGPALASWVNEPLPRLEAGNPEEKINKCQLPCSSKDVQDIYRLFGTQRHNHEQNEVNGELSAVSQDATKEEVWRPATTLSHSGSETSWNHSRDVPRDC